MPILLNLNGEARHNHVTVGRNYGHVLEANIVVGRGLDHHSPDDRPAFNYLQLGAVGDNTTVIPEQKFQSKLVAMQEKHRTEIHDKRL